jgi:hypothetical protein
LLYQHNNYSSKVVVKVQQLLVRLLRRFPQLPQAAVIRAALDRHLTAENLLVEADYFQQPQRQSFERPYGWAWLLKLAEELHGWDDSEGMAWSRRWSRHLQPLVEVIVARILPTDEFTVWLDRFLPGMAAGRPESLFSPAVVSDRRDPQIVHLDGLNLSRAWCMRRIAAALPQRHPARPVLLASAERHTETAVPHVTSGHYVGEHWLASFAVYLLTLPAALSPTGTPQPVDNQNYQQ